MSPTFLLGHAFILLAPAAVVAAKAHGYARSPITVATLALAAAVGAVVFDVGLVALAYNGNAEDYGTPPGRTLGTAIPALSIGAVVVVGAWLAAGRRS